MESFDTSSVRNEVLFREYHNRDLFAKLQKVTAKQQKHYVQSQEQKY